MNELDRLIEKHRATGLLIDSNLLVLLFVGRTNPSRIINFKRTSSYRREDYELLEQLASVFRRILTTTHILTEVSNLVSPLLGFELTTAREIFKQFVGVADELHESNQVITDDAVFHRLGLTDAAIATVCHNRLVLTDDVGLYESLGRRGHDVIYFRHIRALNRWATS